MKTVETLKDIKQTKGDIYVNQMSRIVRVVDLRKLTKMGINNVIWVAIPLENGCHALMEAEEYV